jgi:hypothetical protein
MLVLTNRQRGTTMTTTFQSKLFSLAAAAALLLPCAYATLVQAAQIVA